MCWALVQRGFTSSVHSLQVVVEYQKETCYSVLSKASRCSIQQGRGPLWAFFVVVLCAHLFVVPCIFDSHPSFFPFTVIGSCIKPHCFYSISCHYQQQFDYWVHLVGGEQWRQQAVFSFTLPPILSSPLERIKWGLPVRDEAARGKSDALPYSSGRPNVHKHQRTRSQEGRIKRNRVFLSD